MQVAETILEMAATRGLSKTICPSEVARRLWPDDWRPHMQQVRTAAFELRDKGKINILQKGKTVEGTEITGPIRIGIL